MMGTSGDRLRRQARYLRIAVPVLGVGLMVTGAVALWFASQGPLGFRPNGGWFDGTSDTGLLYGPPDSRSGWFVFVGGAFLVLATLALLLPTYALSKLFAIMADTLDGEREE